MPKKFYCSSCGTELIHQRKAVPGKGVIVDLISPHECEGFAIRSDESNKPTVLEVIDEMKDMGEMRKAESQEIHTGFGEGLKDMRGEQSSSAPKNLIEDVKDGKL